MVIYLNEWSKRKTDQVGLVGQISSSNHSARGNQEQSGYLHPPLARRREVDVDEIRSQH